MHEVVRLTDVFQQGAAALLEKLGKFLWCRTIARVFNEQPAAMAGAAFLVIIAAGKFHRVIAYTGPTGCFVTNRRF